MRATFTMKHYCIDWYKYEDAVLMKICLCVYQRERERERGRRVFIGPLVPLGLMFVLMDWVFFGQVGIRAALSRSPMSAALQ